MWLGLCHKVPRETVFPTVGRDSIGLKAKEYGQKLGTDPDSKQEK